MLHARPYSDTSLLVEVFTSRHGRIGLIARGARAPKSRKRVLLQVLQPLLLSWQEAGDLGTLTSVEAAANAITLTGEPLFCAWYANELLLKLCSRHDAHPQLFAAYARLLLRLADDAEAGLRAFEKVLLDELGYGIEWPAVIEPALSYHYHPTQGLRPAAPHDAPAQCYRGSSLIALDEDALQSPQDYQDSRRLLRAALAPLLNGRTLESARLLRELRGLEGGIATLTQEQVTPST